MTDMTLLDESRISVVQDLLDSKPQLILNKNQLDKLKFAELLAA